VPNKFHTSSAKKLTLNQTPVIIVPGKAFFDVGHSLKEPRSNEKPSPLNVLLKTMKIGLLEPSQ
jgi:hypothetical protein